MPPIHIWLSRQGLKIVLTFQVLLRLFLYQRASRDKFPLRLKNERSKEKPQPKREAWERLKVDHATGSDKTAADRLRLDAG